MRDVFNIGKLIDIKSLKSKSKRHQLGDIVGHILVIYEFKPYISKFEGKERDGFKCKAYDDTTRELISFNTCASIVVDELNSVLLDAMNRRATFSAESTDVNYFIKCIVAKDEKRIYLDDCETELSISRDRLEALVTSRFYQDNRERSN